ncbi:pentatricopeptide repeat-containing protein 2, mitochondrial-like [Contarinia nasturtii]|uniref:pentatricopeptide repeat-containing protein 2, mitochondrial-like n=1 Tax=Contarinia nasturtii TaxID=265458 RepID=UPI0012D49C18|nr:pentatricopeptide repeat-containing protein 2, mitochondrial-like [Contarinia nasturtii]
MLILKYNSTIYKELLRVNAVVGTAKRTLISEQKLGITAYENNRFRTQQIIRKVDLKTLESAIRFNNMTIVSDITKRWCHIMDRAECEANFELLRKSLSFIYSSSALSSSSFDFGSLTMRMLYHLDLPEKALELNDDLHIGGMFQRLTCSLVLGDLLFKRGMYEKLLEDIRERRDLQSKQEKGTSRLMNYLAMAAYYKLNTPKHLDYALNVWADSVKEHQMDQSASFLAMLAINQSKPEIALEVLPPDNKRFSTANVRLIALSECGRFNEAGNTMKDILSTYERGFKISAETIIGVQKTLQDNLLNKDAVLCMDLLNEIVQKRNISNMTIDEILCWPVSENVDRNDGELKKLKKQ